jgi:uncharacterized protein (TIGR02466 family)
LEAADPAGLQLTNQGGWHSHTALVQDPQLSELFQWIARSTQQALQQFGWDFSKATPCFNNAWAMVSRDSHSVRAHLHPNSLFSGVFYLAVPPGSGAIAFLDPRGGAQMLVPPLTDGHQLYAQGRVRYAPKPGELLLFPSWLWHEVEPTQGPDVSPRICLSFNLGMKPVVT